MDEEELLQKISDLAEENNRLLKKLVSHNRWQKVWGLFKIALFFAPLVIGYIYLSPYLQQMFGLYQKLQNIEQIGSGLQNGIQNLPSIPGLDINGILQKLQGASQ